MPACMTGGPVQQIMLHTSYTMQSYQVDEDAITVSWQVPRHNDVHVGTASNPSGAGGGGHQILYPWQPATKLHPLEVSHYTVDLVEENLA